MENLDNVHEHTHDARNLFEKFFDPIFSVVKFTKNVAKNFFIFKICFHYEPGMEYSLFFFSDFFALLSA